MEKTFCDVCKKELTGKVHYSISEVEKNLPTGNPKRWLYLRQGKREIVGREEPWVAYVGLHFCEGCFKKPIVPANLLKLPGARGR